MVPFFVREHQTSHHTICTSQSRCIVQIIQVIQNIPSHMNTHQHHHASCIMHIIHISPITHAMHVIHIMHTIHTMHTTRDIHVMQHIHASPPPLQFIGRCHPYATMSASQAVPSRMHLTLHATRRPPHGASRLVLAMSAWPLKTRRAPFGHCKDSRVYGRTPTAMPNNAFTLPPRLFPS